MSFIEKSVNYRIEQSSRFPNFKFSIEFHIVILMITIKAQNSGKLIKMFSSLRGSFLKF